jgi:hypothetical protein
MIYVIISRCLATNRRPHFARPSKRQLGRAKSLIGRASRRYHSTGWADDSVLHALALFKSRSVLAPGCYDTGFTAAVAGDMSRSTALTLFMHRSGTNSSARPPRTYAAALHYRETHEAAPVTAHFLPALRRRKVRIAKAGFLPL